MNTKLFRILDISFAWLAFLIALIVYSITVAPSLSFWDCGEFISAAYKLEVGHPPGAPMYLLIGRIFSLFAGNDVTQVALAVNMLSVFASAFTILFLYWTIAYFAKRMIAPKRNYSIAQTVAIVAASMMGSLVFTFSDTFWFSAVEAEVYGLSSFFTAIVFWAMLKWNDTKDESVGFRWIILISLLIGMSIGVHLLNLLAMPAIAMIYYYRKFKITKLGIIIALFISATLIAIVMWGIIPGTVKVAAQFELFMVNILGMGYNSGFLLWAIITTAVLGASIYVTRYVDNIIINSAIPSLGLVLIAVPFLAGNVFLNIILTAAMVYGIFVLAQRRKDILHVVMLSATMLMIGYSAYATIIIRSNANPPMDQNNPENVFNLLYYLNREQYGSHPLVKGEHFNARAIESKDGDPVYVQRDGRYEIVGHRPVHVYDERDISFFPRMYSQQPHHIEDYKAWGGMSATQQRPDFGNNIKYFLNYQINWMYWRYFMWNFAGRQNDYQGHGNVIHGNWISGIPFIDNARLGDQSKLPDYLKDNKANNKYYMLPFLLGLIGLGYQIFRHLKDWSVIALLFILTGLAIIVFLNQHPQQPRERDYAYVGSFYAFAIWVGLGLIAIYQLLKNHINGTAAAGIATILCFPAPIIMASENWDDHDRSNRFVARDMAYNYLITCEPNSILFTRGDNDTFPIWYAQNVEGIGLDVKVSCLPYFMSDWYVDQMKMATYEADPMPLQYDRIIYEPSVRDIVMYNPIGQNEDRGHISIDSLLNFIADDRYSVLRQPNTTLYTYHKNRVFLRVDSAKVVDNGTVRPENAHLIEDVIAWDMNRSSLYKNELMSLDMLRSFDWDRPIYHTSIGGREVLGLEPYYQNEGFSLRFVPIKSNSSTGIVDTEILYDNLMNRYRWGNMNDPDVYIDETIRRSVRTSRIRQNFRILATELLELGDTERAKMALEKCDSIMPLDIFVPTLFDIELAIVWFQMGYDDEGSRIIDKVLYNTMQELDFFFSLNKDKFLATHVEVITSLATFERALHMLYEFGDENRFEKLMHDLDQYIRHYERLAGPIPEYHIGYFLNKHFS